MQTYTFPSRDELSELLQRNWPMYGNKQLVDRVLGFSGVTINADAIAMALVLAIEDVVSATNRSEGFRLSAIASLPAVIRTLVSDPIARNLALNEYDVMLDRLVRLGN